MKLRTTSPNAALASPRPPASTAHSKQTGIDVKPSRVDVARKAYFIYLNQGSPQGHDVQHWLEAEAQALSASEQRTSVL